MNHFADGVVFGYGVPIDSFPKITTPPLGQGSQDIVLLFVFCLQQILSVSVFLSYSSNNKLHTNLFPITLLFFYSHDR
jgi:hypothetical protein